MASSARDSWLRADWPVSRRVNVLCTTKSSAPRFAEIFAARAPDNFKVLAVNQVHGATVVRADALESRVDADGIWTTRDNVACAVRTADCLPVVLADQDGTVVAVVHAGWRGLLAGVIENAVAAVATHANSALHAWFGPAICATHYQVGADVHDPLLRKNELNAQAFKNDGEKWLCSLKDLARVALQESGIEDVYGGRWCTYADAERFHSYRRDKNAGRMHTIAWLGEPIDVTQ